MGGEVVLVLIGNVTALFIFFAPFKRLQEIRQTQDTGPTDGLPFPLMLFQSLNWVVYCFLTDDYLMVICNFIGVLCGMYYTLIFHGANKENSMRLKLELMTIFALLIPELFSAGVFWGTSDPKVRSTVFGVFADVVSIAFMGSPLLQMFKVIKQRDASSIHLPLAAAMAINGIFWAGYGFFLNDPYVYIPNVLGCLMGMTQLVLRLLFGARAIQSKIAFDSDHPVGVNITAHHAAEDEEDGIEVQTMRMPGV